MGPCSNLLPSAMRIEFFNLQLRDELMSPRKGPYLLVQEVRTASLRSQSASVCVFFVFFWTQGLLRGKGDIFSYRRFGPCLCAAISAYIVFLAKHGVLGPTFGHQLN